MTPRQFSILLALALAGCGSVDMANYDYRQRYPVGVSRHEAVAEIAAPAGGGTLAAADLTRLDQLGREHIRRGAGPVTVTVGAGPGVPAQAAAAAFGRQVAAALSLPAGEVAVSLIPLKPPPNGRPAALTARVTVPVWVADTPDCGPRTRPVTPDYANGDMASFGCAIQRNLGLMVQDPADLVRMRDSSGRDGNRAADVLDKYRRGVATGSAKEDSTGSTASDIGAGK